MVRTLTRVAVALFMCAPVFADEGGFIVGSVLDIDGKPVPEANLSVVRDGPRSLERLLPQPKWQTAADGRFRIGPIPQGEYGVFLFGAKSHSGHGATPATDVTVSAGKSPEITLRLRPIVSVKIAVGEPESEVGLSESLYWLESAMHPLQGGRSIAYSSTFVSRKWLQISCFPGKIRLSPDPSFHPMSEVFEYTVTEQGELIGPKTVPSLVKTVPVDFSITRSDGQPVTQVKIYGIPEFARYEIEGSIVEQGGGGIGTHFRCFADPRIPHRYRLTRGIATRMLVTAHGCKPLLTPLIVPSEAMKPTSAVLEPAQLVDVTVQTKGLTPLQLRKSIDNLSEITALTKRRPDDVEILDSYQLKDFICSFQEPSGLWLWDTWGPLHSELRPRNFNFSISLMEQGSSYDFMIPSRTAEKGSGIMGRPNSWLE